MLTKAALLLREDGIVETGVSNDIYHGLLWNVNEILMKYDKCNKQFDSFDGLPEPRQEVQCIKGDMSFNQ